MTVENTVAKYRAAQKAGNHEAALVLKKHMQDSPKYKGNPILVEFRTEDQQHNPNKDPDTTKKIPNKKPKFNFRKKK